VSGLSRRFSDLVQTLVLSFLFSRVSRLGVVTVTKVFTTGDLIELQRWSPFVLPSAQLMDNEVSALLSATDEEHWERT
jgi:hypothetical protein